MAKTKYKKGDSMDINSPEGTKVMGLFKDGSLLNGYDFQKIDAERFVKPNIKYTVDHTVVHSWSSEVYLKEFPEHSFNTVHFIHA